MNIIKRGNKYGFTYRCRGLPHSIYESFDTEEEARLRAAQIDLGKKTGTLLPPDKFVDPDVSPTVYKETVTVAQLMDEYVQLHGLAHWSPSTFAQNKHLIEDYIKPFIGAMYLRQLTPRRLEMFYGELRKANAKTQEGKEKQKIGESVASKVHCLMRSALKQALRWDYMDGGNPALLVDPPKEHRHVRETWSDEEAKRALDLCEDPILHLCISLALGCSLRVGEVLGLTWENVHIAEEGSGQDSFISIRQELRRVDRDAVEKLREAGTDDVFFVFPSWKRGPNSTALVLKSLKTESSRRDVYLPSAVAEELLATKAEQEKMMRILDYERQDYGLVVAQVNGRPYEQAMITAKLNKLIRDHDLKNVVFHSLRHSSTSMKLKLSGGNIKAVQGDTGHSQSRMVTDVYSHTMTEDRRQLARQMDEQFFRAAAPASPAAPADSTGKPTLTQKQLLDVVADQPELAVVLLQKFDIVEKK